MPRRRRRDRHRLPGRRQPHRVHRGGAPQAPRRPGDRRVRRRRAQRHVRRRGVRAPGLDRAARGRPPPRPAPARRVLGRQLRVHPAGRRRQRLADVGGHPAEHGLAAAGEPVRPAGRRARRVPRAAHPPGRLRRVHARPGRAAARRRRGRRAQRQVPGLPQLPRGDHAGHDPGVGRDPQRVPGRPHRRRHVLGRPVLPEPARARAARRRPRRAVGDPDQPDGARRGAPHGAGHRRPPQRAGGQPLALPGAARHRGDRPAARRGRAGRQPLQAHHRAGAGVRAAAVDAPARVDVQAQPRRPVPEGADGRRASGRPRSSSRRWASRARGAPRTSKRCSATSRRTCS